jgi:sarcosine dehydrogenase
MTKVIIIGGGVVGTSIAWHLAQEPDSDVLLLERDQLSAGTTWHSAGNMTWIPNPAQDAPVLYAFETVKRLETMGLNTGWLRTGRIFIGSSREVLASLETFQNEAHSRGIAARWLTPADAQSLNPHLQASKVEGLWLNPLSGRLNPSDLTQAYAAAARRAGAKIVQGVAVRSIVATAGKITGVETQEGFVPADHVVVAAGLWSRSLLEPLGISLAQWPCEHFYVIANVSPRLNRETPSFVAPDKLIYGREEVGSLLVGFFDEDAKTIDPADLPEPFTFTLLPPDWDKIAPYFMRAVELFPALESAPVQRFINGPESFTPDGLPLIGCISDLDGLVVATAMNSSGVTLSAMAGALVASLVAEREAPFPAKIYEPLRFGQRGADLAWLKPRISAIVSKEYREASLAHDHTATST